jgi:glycine oxidase
VKSSDAIILGGGIIGLSLAVNLRKHGLSVILIDRTEPGREASWAAAGMIASCDPRLKPSLVPLAKASAELYPEFIHELQDESQLNIDFRQDGTIWFGDGVTEPHGPGVRTISERDLTKLEPRLSFRSNTWLLPEHAVDPRTLLAALVKTARHRDVEIATGSPALSVEVAGGHVTGVRTERATYAAGAVVNCTGAWAGQVAPLSFPTRPVKGHMLSVISQHQTLTVLHASPQNLLRHVVRAPEVYIVPRAEGKYVIGSTSEEAGFDKTVNVDTIQRLHQAAANLVPDIGELRIHEAWAGLRPGTPDAMPILGTTDIRGYFVATGHYRDGIMLAPITAALMADVMLGGEPKLDLSAFSPARFGAF